jgi:hypothetical protein
MIRDRAQMARLQLTVCMFALHAQRLRTVHPTALSEALWHCSCAATVCEREGSVHIRLTAVAILLWMLAEAAELHTVPSGLYGNKPRDGSMHLASTSKADDVWLREAASQGLSIL